MFEIIMLFAFLYAATCQLFPKRPGTTRAPVNQQGQHGKEETATSQRSAQKNRTTPVHLSKTKSRYPRYAYAA